tara:strand:- start:308 stop:715 length:408 start_codon:yes stop_codon:yes gene_type:complete
MKKISTLLLITLFTISASAAVEEVRFDYPMDMAVFKSKVAVGFEFTVKTRIPLDPECAKTVKIGLNVTEVFARTHYVAPFFKHNEKLCGPGEETELKSESFRIMKGNKDDVVTYVALLLPKEYEVEVSELFEMEE